MTRFTSIQDRSVANSIAYTLQGSTNTDQAREGIDLKGDVAEEAQAIDSTKVLQQNVAVMKVRIRGYRHHHGMIRGVIDEAGTEGTDQNHSDTSCAALLEYVGSSL